MNTVSGAAKAMITWPPITMILVSASCSALAQVALKHLMLGIWLVTGGR